MIGYNGFESSIANKIFLVFGFRFYFRSFIIIRKFLLPVDIIEESWTVDNVYTSLLSCHFKANM
jgi:hypothetical protein